MNLVVSIPAWGDWHTLALLHTTLPTLRASLDGLGAGDVRFIVHTDRADFLRPAFRGLDVMFLPVPWHSCFYNRLGLAHKDALRRASDGEAIMLLCADQVLSRETVRFCSEKIAAGTKAVACLGPRALANPAEIPVGLCGADLSSWCWDNAHPWTRELIWQKGRGFSPSIVYFVGQTSVVAHAFHLHPIIVLKDRPLDFKRETIDNDLLECFRYDEIAIVTKPDEMAMAEISPPEKMVGLRDLPLDPSYVAAWASRNALPIHRWMFNRRIVIKGDGRDADDLPVHDILERLLPPQRGLAA